MSDDNVKQCEAQIEGACDGEGVDTILGNAYGLQAHDICGSQCCVGCRSAASSQGRIGWEQLYARIRERRRGQVCRDADGRELKVGDVVVGTERTDTKVRVERIKNDLSFCGVEISGPRQGERGDCYSTHYWRHVPPPAKASGFEVGDRVRFHDDPALDAVVTGTSERGSYINVRFVRDGSEGKHTVTHCKLLSKAPGGSADAAEKGSVVGGTKPGRPKDPQAKTPVEAVRVPSSSAAPPGDLLRFGPDEYPSSFVRGLAVPAPGHLFQRLEQYARWLHAEQVGSGGHDTPEAREACREMVQAGCIQVFARVLEFDRHICRLERLGCEVWECDEYTQPGRALPLMNRA